MPNPLRPPLKPHSSPLPTPPPPLKDPETDIEERILRRREMAHLFQWYYPEGGWGWVVLLCACLSRAIAEGMQLALAFPAAWEAAKKFRLGQGEEGGPAVALQVGESLHVQNTHTHTDRLFDRVPNLR